MTNTAKLRIDAQGMTEVKSLSDEILRILWNRIPDISIDQCQTDIVENEEKAFEEESALSKIILEMILTDIRREF